MELAAVVIICDANSHMVNIEQYAVLQLNGIDSLQQHWVRLECMEGNKINGKKYMHLQWLWIFKVLPSNSSVRALDVLWSLACSTAARFTSVWFSAARFKSARSTAARANAVCVNAAGCVKNSTKWAEIRLLSRIANPQCWEIRLVIHMCNNSVLNLTKIKKKIQKERFFCWLRVSALVKQLSCLDIWYIWNICVRLCRCR